MSEADKIFNKLNTLERLFYGAWLWNNGVYEKIEKAKEEYNKKSRVAKWFYGGEPYIRGFMLMDYPYGGDTPRVEKLMKLTGKK